MHYIYSYITFYTYNTQDILVHCIPTQQRKNWSFNVCTALSCFLTNMEQKNNHLYVVEGVPVAIQLIFVWEGKVQEI